MTSKFAKNKAKSKAKSRAKSETKMIYSFNVKSKFNNGDIDK